MKPISTRAYRKLRFTNRTPTVGDRVFLHKPPSGIVGTVVSMHDDPYVPVIDIELSNGQTIEMVPRSNVRVVSEATKRETMKITKGQLRRIIRESIEAITSPPKWNAPIADLEAWWAYELGDPDVRVEKIDGGTATFIGTGGGMSRGYEGAPELMRVRSKQLEGGYLELTGSEWLEMTRE